MSPSSPASPGSVALPRAGDRLSPGVWSVAALGVAALLARPWLLPAGVEIEWRVAFFVALGAAGALLPLPAGSEQPPARVGPSLAVLAAGALAFALGRAVVAVPAGPRHLVAALALNAMAAVAEEAFFRRHLFGVVVARHGTSAAVVMTASAFALAHVTVWGWWVLPLDLAAGLVLSWQRAATRRWTVPAATHVVANTLAVL